MRSRQSCFRGNPGGKADTREQWRLFLQANASKHSKCCHRHLRDTENYFCPKSSSSPCIPRSLMSSGSAGSKTQGYHPRTTSSMGSRRFPRGQTRSPQGCVGSELSPKAWAWCRRHRMEIRTHHEFCHPKPCSRSLVIHRQCLQLQGLTALKPSKPAPHTSSHPPTQTHSHRQGTHTPAHTYARRMHTHTHARTHTSPPETHTYWAGRVGGRGVGEGKRVLRERWFIYKNLYFSNT